MKRFLYALFIVVLCLFVNENIQAQDSNALFVQANEFAAARQYDKAVESYQQLLITGVESAEVEFNLANSYLELGRLGEAILHYERAALLDTNDEAIQQNLRLARERVRTDMVAKPTFALTCIWNNIKMSASSELWTVITLLFFWLSMGGLVLWQIGKERQQRKKGFFAGIAFLLLTIIPFFLAMGKAKIEQDSGAGIIISKNIGLHTTAAESSPIVRELPVGTKVYLFDIINDWYKVELINGEEGWLRIEAFKKI